MEFYKLLREKFSETSEENYFFLSNTLIDFLMGRPTFLSLKTD